MPLEIHASKYLFKPAQTVDSLSAVGRRRAKLRKLVPRFRDDMFASSATTTPKPSLTRPAATPIRSIIPFRHNPLHDLESLLWVCMFTTLGANYKNDGRPIS